MGQLTENLISQRKSLQRSCKKIHRRRYITLNEYEKMKSVLLKNKVYITRSKLIMGLNNNNEYCLCDDSNNKEPILDIYHSSLSIFTTQNNKKTWHFKKSVEKEKELIHEGNRLQEKEKSITISKNENDFKLYNNSQYLNETTTQAVDYNLKKEPDMVATPVIKPFLSELCIYDIQEAQKECKERSEFAENLRARSEQQRDSSTHHHLQDTEKVSSLEAGGLLQNKAKGQKGLSQIANTTTQQSKRKESKSPTGRNERIKGRDGEKHNRQRGSSQERKKKTTKGKKTQKGDKTIKQSDKIKGRDGQKHDRQRGSSQESRKTAKEMSLKPQKGDKTKEHISEDKSKIVSKQSDKTMKGNTISDKQSKSNMLIESDKEKYDDGKDSRKKKQLITTSESKTSKKTKSSRDKSEGSHTDKSVKSKEKMHSSKEDLKTINQEPDSVTSKRNADKKLKKNATGDAVSYKSHETGIKSKNLYKVSALESSKGTKSKDLSKDASRKGKKVVFDLYTIYYQLSNEKYIKLGWTVEPRDSEFSRIVTFQAHAAHPQNYAFREREVVEEKFYRDGNLAFKFHQDGTGKVLYNSGEPAMIFTQNNFGKRVTIYSESKNDTVNGHMKSQLLGIFDSYGNGIVYNDLGNIRLNFDQAEGILYESRFQKTFKWQWQYYKTIKEQRMLAMLKYISNEEAVTTSKVNKSVSTKHKQKNTYLENIELPVPQPPLKIEKYSKPFSPITLKISNEILLKIMGQDKVVLSFNSMKISLSIDLGVIIEPNVEVRIDEMDVNNKTGNIPCVFEVLKKKTPSLMKIARELQALRQKTRTK